MERSKEAAGVLTIRIDAGLRRLLTREARRRQTTQSAVVRGLLAAGLGSDREDHDLATEARRQSILVSGRPSEQETLEFLEHVADTRGWE